MDVRYPNVPDVDSGWSPSTQVPVQNFSRPQTPGLGAQPPSSSAAPPNYSNSIGGMSILPSTGQNSQSFTLDGVDPNLVTSVGLAYGSQAFYAGQQYLNQNMNRFVNPSQLKYYFAVSNEYVLKKLNLLLFPFKNPSWNRLQVATQTQPVLFAPPRDDINAPDMYIPTMAFVTFILLIGFAMGQKNAFTPEILGMTLSTGLGVVAFEVLFIKFGCYLFNMTAEAPWLDLIAYCGYKFVGMIVVLLCFLLFSSIGFWLSFLYTSAALTFFLSRSLRHSLVGAPSSSSGFDPQTKPQGHPRKWFLLAIVMLQIATSFFLLQH